jgi:hypothetical protein
MSRPQEILEGASQSKKREMFMAGGQTPGAFRPDEVPVG